MQEVSLTLERVYSGCMGWVHAPPPPLAALDDFSISLGEFSIFWWNFFVPQTEMDLFRLSIGIFILWKFDDNKNKAKMAIAKWFVPPPLQEMFLLCYVGPLLLRFFPQVPYMSHIMNLKKVWFEHFNKLTQTGVKGC
jgi:hypothetical protein